MTRLLPILLLVADLAAAPPPVEPALSPVESAVEGERLRAELLAQRPAKASEISGTFKMRDAEGARREVRVQLRTELLDATAWRAVYQTLPSTASSAESLIIARRAGSTNEYVRIGTGGIYGPFAGSDFSAADLGLEFLHWPTQRVLKTEMKSSRSCRVLESINAAPAAGAYARVLSWIDLETSGVVRAEAYDKANKLVKEFSLKSFKKVEGQWQLREMEIISYPTDSRTRLEFELNVEASGK